MAEIRYRYALVDDVEVFYRSAGNIEAPTVLLLHGFPSSSFQYRHMLAGLSDKWHLVAPDLPGFGFTKVRTRQPYSYTFDSLAETIARWIEKLDLNISAAYLHDYGGHVGFRLLARNVVHPRAIVIQNTEAYRSEGWRDPMRGIEARQKESPEEGRARLKSTLINEAGIWKEFFEDLPSNIAERIDPAAFQLGWTKICSPGVLEAMLDLHMDYGSNVCFYKEIQTYFRNTDIPTLLLWGERDQYLATEAAQAYCRDLPKAELVKFDGGHWLLESHSEDVNNAVRRFLSSSL
jgi:pimeloyl-ACP methyl ester carboxylesterase